MARRSLTWVFVGWACIFLSSCSEGRFDPGLSQSKNDEGKGDPSVDQNQNSSEAISAEKDSNVASEEVDVSGNNGDDSRTPEEVKINEEIETICLSNEQEVASEMISFPAREGCLFGEGENQTKARGRIRAMEVQTETFQLPEGSVVCGLEVASVEDEIKYDDAISINVSGYVVMTSVDNRENLEIKGGLPIFDFSRMIDVKASKLNPFCVGTCSLPKSDKKGTFSLSIDESQSWPIALKFQEAGVLNFDLVAMGDDNDKDCSHTGVTLETTLKYVVED